MSDSTLSLNLIWLDPLRKAHSPIALATSIHNQSSSTLLYYSQECHTHKRKITARSEASLALSVMPQTPPKGNSCAMRAD